MFYGREDGFTNRLRCEPTPVSGLYRGSGEYPRLPSVTWSTTVVGYVDEWELVLVQKLGSFLSSVLSDRGPTLERTTTDVPGGPVSSVVTTTGLVEHNEPETGTRPGRPPQSPLHRRGTPDP